LLVVFGIRVFYPYLRKTVGVNKENKSMSLFGRKNMYDREWMAGDLTKAKVGSHAKGKMGLTYGVLHPWLRGEDNIGLALDLCLSHLPQPLIWCPLLVV
jgi:hypothetical protein